MRGGYLHEYFPLPRHSCYLVLSIDHMENKNRRQFSRVPIQWAAQLDFGAREYKHFVDNVSLGGIYVKGRFDQVISDVFSNTVGNTHE